LRYPKEVILKDGGEAVIRPLEKADESSLIEFYQSIPETDRWYMKYNVLDQSLIHKWINAIDRGNVLSIISLVDKKITAHAGLFMRAHGSTQHVGRLRIVVLPEFRQKRLGTWMLLDLIRLAMDRGLSDLRADFVVGIEDAAINSAYKLDFFKKAVLEEYVKDPQGTRHDLMVMGKRLHKDWGDF
jgi:L-amino acid N-acyltransferase YncA